MKAVKNKILINTNEFNSLKETLKDLAIISIKPKQIESAALSDLLKKPKFKKLYNSKNKTNKTKAQLYIKQYTLINYESILKLLALKKELKLWSDFIKDQLKEVKQ
jgi:hypothetical protein